MKSRKLLMIPGPIEFEPEVMRSLGSNTTSHVAPNFIELFGHSIELMRDVWLSKEGQPFIISGSGTLAMDSPAANLIEEGDKALVISTGYFGERYADLLKRYGADVKILKAPLGGIVSIDDIEKELKQTKYKLLTFTHVDTSTAVMNDPKPIGKLGKKYDVLTILDGVCSVAGEEIRQDEWGIDVVLTASQKAISVPPGLALFVVSKKALDVWKKRKEPVKNYYGDWTNWLPIMNAYEERRPSYFATPPVNLIAALHTSMDIIMKEGMETRFTRHEKMNKAFKEAIKSLGLKQVPTNEKYYSNTLTAPYFPDNIDGKALLAATKESGVILAGGLLADIKTKYFRIGHMGQVNNSDILATVGAIEYGLIKAGYKIEAGKGLSAAQKILINS